MSCLESSLGEKDWGVLVDKLNVRHQCVLVAKKVNSLLHCIRKNITSRLWKMIPPCSHLWWDISECLVHFQATVNNIDMDILEWVQCRVMELSNWRICCVTKGQDCLSWRKEGLMIILPYGGKEQRRWRQTLTSAAQWKDKRQQVQNARLNSA